MEVIHKMRTSKYLKKFAKKNRNNMTKAEKLFEAWLYMNKIRFSKQYPISIIDDSEIYNSYIIDFKVGLYCIEIDGSYHNTDEQKIKDNKRDYLLNKVGYKVIRIKNDDVFSLNLNWLFEYIKPTNHKTWLDKRAKEIEKSVKIISDYKESEKYFMIKSVFLLKELLKN